MNYAIYKMNNITGAQFNNGVNIMTNSIAPIFSEEESYNVGDFVMYNGLLYICIDDDFVPGAWDADQWEQHKIFDNQSIIFDSNTSV